MSVDPAKVCCAERANPEILACLATALMIPGLSQKRLTRYLIVMTILVGGLGMILRLATRCELEVLRSLNLANIRSCAMLRDER